MKTPRCKSCKHTMKGHKKKLCLREQTLHIDGVYIGTTYNGIPSGRGTLFSDKHTRYKGEWLNGKRHGYGIQHKCDCYMYKGNWSNDKHNGHGELQTSGFTYTGGFRHGRYHGRGRLFIDSDHYYDGIWSRGNKHEHGTYVTPTGKYEGEFYFNLKHGHGVYTTQDSIYNGEWRSSLRHGRGVYTTPEGTYTGEWANNFYHGYGRFLSIHMGLYVGCWKQGKRHNKGKQIYLNGTVYHGGWSRGLKTGHGSVKYQDGTVYEGFWLEDEYNGRGVLSTPDGVFFKGEWNCGEREGLFVETDGEYIKTGKWVCDLRHGTFTITNSVSELYLWGTKTDFTLKQARKAVRKMLSKRDYLSAEEVLLFFPTLVKWKLFKNYDHNGILLNLLNKSTIRHKFCKHAYCLFLDKRYAFVERLFVLAEFRQIRSILFDCITDNFVANPWVVSSQSYSEQTKCKLLEGLHLGEFGRCQPTDPFTRQKLTEKSGKWLRETPKKARSVYRDFVRHVLKPEEIDEIAFSYDVQDYEKLIRNAMASNDRDTIQLLMKERNELIQKRQRTQRGSSNL